MWLWKFLHWKQVFHTLQYKIKLNVLLVLIYDRYYLSIIYKIKLSLTLLYFSDGCTNLKIKWVLFFLFSPNNELNVSHLWVIFRVNTGSVPVVLSWPAWHSNSSSANGVSLEAGLSVCLTNDSVYHYFCNSFWWC